MTTKKRSKPRALWVVLDQGGNVMGTRKTKAHAVSRFSLLKAKYSCECFEIVKYVREVKRK